MGALIPFVVPHTGLLGLMLITTVFMTGSLLCGDRAYALSEEHGFAPDSSDNKNNKIEEVQRDDTPESSRLEKTVALFRRTPTLQALLGEVVAYQGFSTILNVAFVRSLQDTITDDIARSAFTGRFYSMINAISTTIQLALLPFLLKRFEQADLWRTMPIWPLLSCVLLVFRGHDLSLTMLTGAFCLTKIMDYSFRTVTYIMVYQPLDFEGRYLGKETIGLFGGRFGKSGMSLLISGLTAAGASLCQLCRMAFMFNGLWFGATWWLASTIPSKKEAQSIVDERLEQLDEKGG